MIYRKIDNYGDMVFGQNANDFYAGTMAVAQAIKTSLNLLQGEWWEDQGAGLPLFQHIIGQNGTPESVRGVDALIQEQILSVPGVTGISEFSSTYANRQYTITTCTVQTQHGPAIFSVTFGPNAQYELTLFPAIAKV